MEILKLTIGTTYYNNPDNLKNFIRNHLDHFDHMIIVDDGSSDPAQNYIKPTNKISLYRVKHDYGFNSHGCRNLIMRETQTDWNILMDLDRMFLDPSFAAKAIKAKSLKNNTLYLFEMHGVINDGSTIHPSVNDFLVHKNHFWSAGGYDEENIGMRFGDREYRMQLENYGKEAVIYGVEVKFTRGPTKTDKTQVDVEEYMKANELVMKRIMFPEPNKLTLTFDWEKVF